VTPFATFIRRLQLKVVHLKSNVVDPDPYVLDLPDPDASLLCTDSDPSINKQKKVKKPRYCFFVTSFDFLSLKIDVNVTSKSNKQKNFEEKTYFLLAACQPLTYKVGS
jgi:hypothetical protein